MIGALLIVHDHQHGAERRRAARRWCTRAPAWPRNEDTGHDNLPGIKWWESFPPNGAIGLLAPALPVWLFAAHEVGANASGGRRLRCGNAPCLPWAETRKTCRRAEDGTMFEALITQPGKKATPNGIAHPPLKELDNVTLGYVIIRHHADVRGHRPVLERV